MQNVIEIKGKFSTSFEIFHYFKGPHLKFHLHFQIVHSKLCFSYYPPFSEVAPYM